MGRAEALFRQREAAAAAIYSFKASVLRDGPAQAGLGRRARPADRTDNDTLPCGAGLHCVPTELSLPARSVAGSSLRSGVQRLKQSYSATVR
nr:hypothetical protein StreXyl84_79730 [Streptomyces sp. Xyl84]